MDTKKIYPCQIAVVRTAIRETLNNPTIANYGLAAIVLALEDVTKDLQVKISVSSTDTFAEVSSQSFSPPDDRTDFDRMKFPLVRPVVR